EVAEAETGDIIAITGIPEVAIGQTLVDPVDPIGFPVIKLTEPTLKITLSSNTSPLSGKEGKFSNARQLEQRLTREIKTNIGLVINPNPAGNGFEVAGKGELHLAILIETLRREGYEMQIGKPQVILKKIDGILMEPFEEVTIQTDEKYVGLVMKEIGRRKAEILDMKNINSKTTKFTFTISSRNLLGLRGLLISETSGNSVFASLLLGYKPAGEDVGKIRINGVLVAFESGTSTAYALETVQKRGTAFIGPGELVYEGMIIGLNNRDEDMDINVCKSKKLTNMHTENSDVAIQLDPPVRLTLEQCLDFIGDDELLEVTPKSLRLRKIHLSKINRIRAKRHAGQAMVS
ncbi:translational GTPase TypA, partial [Candidatus Microgenomates bacterium]|nr:translational GTPase TypA [Candidatus Microgenomates bacterium]